MVSESAKPEEAKPGAAVARFVRNRRGAVTIDWVGLSGAILLMGIVLVYALFNYGVGSTSSSINSNLSAIGSGIVIGPAPSQATFSGSGGNTDGGLGGSHGGHGDGDGHDDHDDHETTRFRLPGFDGRSG